MSLKKLVLSLVVSLLFYLIYGLLISQYNVNIIPESLGGRQPNGFYDYSGVINIHTSLSTGSAGHQIVIDAAKNSRLDFLFFTDLNDFKRPKTLEGYHENLLVFVDGEYSYLDSQILNIGAQKSDHLIGVGQSQAFFADLLDRTDRSSEYGLFILSHPFKSKYEWRGHVSPGIDGIEVMNLRSMWQDAYLNSKISFIWSVLIYPFNSDLAFIRLLMNTPEKELSLWDQLTSERRTLGIVGSDAWANSNLLFTQIEFPSYETIFNLARNHVLLKSELTGDVKSDKEKILSALRDGQVYFSLDTLANPKGFLAVLQNSTGEVFPIGSDLPWQKNLDLKIKLPEKPLVPFDVIIYKNGQKMLSSNSKDTTYRIHEPGVYRVMVRVIPTFPLPDGKKWVPWIYTNPFYIRP